MVGHLEFYQIASFFQVGFGCLIFLVLPAAVCPFQSESCSPLEESPNILGFDTQEAV